MKREIKLPALVCYSFICFGMIYLANNIFLGFNWNATTGIVVEVKARPEKKNQFYPIVAFTNHLGKQSSATILQSSNRFFYQEGEEIPILYNPEDSSEARINSMGWRYGFPIFFALLGFIALYLPPDFWQVS
ncbi:MAG: DUF3592 domain-containing protein [Saprospiraceae bacterium]